MGMGGVENKEEFNISLTDLLHWLKSFKNKGEIQKRNAQLLETFLLTKVMPHEKRRFSLDGHSVALSMRNPP